MKGSMLHGGCYLVKGQYTVVMCNTMICKYGVLFNTLPAKHLIHIVLSQLPNDTREKLTLHFCGVVSFIYFLFDPFEFGKLTTNTGVRWIDKAFLDLTSWMVRAIFFSFFFHVSNILLLVLISCSPDLESVCCTSLLKEGKNCHTKNASFSNLNSKTYRSKS